MAANDDYTLPRWALELQRWPHLSLRQTMAEGLPPERSSRQLQRVLRTRFRRIRKAVIEPASRISRSPRHRATQVRPEW
ncbi:hypothetical protein RZV17_15345 [Xanthomonas cannabis]